MRWIRLTARVATGLALTLGAMVSAPAEDASGWDWGAIEALDDTPIQAPRRDSMPTRTVPAPPPVAAPDLQGRILPAGEVFREMPDFSVVPSTKDKEMHPCGNCHRWVKSDPTPRSLRQPHDNFSLQHGLHGRGQFWCFTCHDLAGNGGLKTLEGQGLAFDEAYFLCSQCHVDKARDWAFGAHGKRVGNWQGERTVYNCTACHYQHAPALLYREAMAGPVPRQGLERPAHWRPRAAAEQRVFEHPKPWERTEAAAR